MMITFYSYPSHMISTWSSAPHTHFMIVVQFLSWYHGLIFIFIFKYVFIVLYVPLLTFLIVRPRSYLLNTVFNLIQCFKRYYLWFLFPCFYRTIFFVEKLLLLLIFLLLVLKDMKFDQNLRFFLYHCIIYQVRLTSLLFFDDNCLELLSIIAIMFGLLTLISLYFCLIITIFACWLKYPISLSFFYLFILLIYHYCP